MSPSRPVVSGRHVHTRGGVLRVNGGDQCVQVGCLGATELEFDTRKQGCEHRGMADSRQWSLGYVHGVNEL